MVTRRGARGYSLLEVVVTLAVFGVFLIVVVTLTAEMRRRSRTPARARW
jgi:prepilin-type N-terminal cleavage/methylation domain-containing protein